MSVIIRLQNLPWSANALDIRQYFHGLSIPEGGVHIVGGELGDAFIAFSTDEDARQAFERNNGKIKEVQIKLMLSSRTEMQKIIEAARSQTIAPYIQAVPAPVPIIPAPIPAAVPQIPSQRKDDKESDSDKDRSEKRSRRKSRSRSRDRSRDRDRRDRRRRDRSRSRSRDRRDRRRRDRSYSRERHRSRDRDRKTSKDRRRSDEKVLPTPAANPPKSISPWESQKLELPMQNILNRSILGNPSLEVATHNVPMPIPNNLNFNSSLDGLNSRPSTMQGRFSDPLQYPQNKPTFQDRFNNPMRQQNQFNFDSGNRFSNNSWQNQNGDSSKNFNDRSEAFRDRRREQQHENCCVRLHPFYGGFGEIRRFFSGLFIHNSGIKLLNDKFGKRTGVVFVRFVYPEGKEEALQRNGRFIRKQALEITPLDDEEFDKEVDRYQPPDYIQDVDAEEDDDVIIQDSPNSFRGKGCDSNDSTSNYTCLLVEDLPPYVKEQDILKIFSDFSLMSIIITENRRQRKSLLAYVKFATHEHARNACAGTAMHTLEGKPLKVKPCGDDEFEAINRQQNELMGTDEPQKKIKVESECVCLSGLPQSINERDIADFFCDVGIVPDKINLSHGENGFTGKAFIQFVNLDEAQAAVGKDGMYLGSNVVTVKSISRSELEDALGIRPAPQVNPMSNGPKPFMGNSMHNPMMNNMHPMNNGSRPYFRNNYNNNMNFMPRGMMGPRPFRHLGPPKDYYGPMGPNKDYSGPQGPPRDNYSGPPGCTILMENVPYKAELDEILEFFRDFNIPPDNVLRRYNTNGQPSGETKVIFDNPEEAHRAVQTMHREKIRDRVVYLSLC